MNAKGCNSTEKLAVHLGTKDLKKIDRCNSLHDEISTIQNAQANVVRRTRSITISEPQPTRIQQKFSKNSRRSRSGFGRGLPKKGGAGGKGVWGKLGSELLDEAMDPHDPNYDSECMDDDVKLEAVTVEMSEKEIKDGGRDLIPTNTAELEFTETLVLEYYDHGDTSEVDAVLTDKAPSINFKKRYLFVMVMVEVAMDHKPSHREMTSVLLSDLYQECITQTDICRGFEQLLASLPDLILDCPEAPTILGNFMARAVADDCLPPKYLSSFKGRVECPHAIRALDRADLLMSMKHGMVRLDSVWGAGGARRPVRSLVKQMTSLLKEFLSSLDAVEAIRCLKELEVPHFHHELVFEALVMAIERSDSRSIQEMLRLLKAMYDDGVLTSNQMDEGFVRVFENMADIELDVPMAFSLLEHIIGMALQHGILSREASLKVPTRGRKRFVSEGDGGRFKERVLPQGFPV